MNKTIVITGANRGIGLELTKHYLACGDKVYALCRNVSGELAETNARIIEGVDVADPKSMSQILNEIGSVSVDLLINNAGILQNESIDDMNFESMQRQFEVNSLGPLRITLALLGNLKNGSKIGLITSRMGSIADNTSGSRYGYRMSKAALNIAGVSLARDLNSQGISVAIIHPGFVQTDMVGGMGDLSPSESAQRIAQRLDELSLETSGTFWHSSGEVLPW